MRQPLLDNDFRCTRIVNHTLNRSGILSRLESELKVVLEGADLVIRDRGLGGADTGQGGGEEGHAWGRDGTIGGRQGGAGGLGREGAGAGALGGGAGAASEELRLAGIPRPSSTHLSPLRHQLAQLLPLVVPVAIPYRGERIE